MEVDLNVAYSEACKAIGEAHIRERLLGQRIAELEEQIASLTKQVLHPDDDSGASEH